MAIRDYLPFVQEKKVAPGNALALVDNKPLIRAMKIAAVALGYNGSVLFYNSRSSFEFSPYNFDRIIQAKDTDSYIRQGIIKYKELIWKEGWNFVSENSEALSYLRKRVDFLEASMNRPFDDFLLDVTEQLVTFNNCFVAKSRGDLGKFFPGSLTKLNKDGHILGYYIIPTETASIERDVNNRPTRYQQRIDGYATGEDLPTWRADEVIHLYIDKKPGHAFGTPFLESCLDDVIALRQLEEDIQNLSHRELFPLYKYKVGNDTYPALDEEITRAAAELENLRTDGGLVLSERYDVDVIGAAGEVLDIDPYLGHFKERVAIGLGLAPHHLGMTMNGGNREMTDRLDTALYDKAKMYQRYLAENIRLNILNELLLEGGYNPFLYTSLGKNVNRCFFKFNEIDVDSQVKKENHTLQKFTDNVIDIGEARQMLNLNPEFDEDQCLAAIVARVTAKYDPKPVTAAGATTSGAVASTANKSKPANQHGIRPSPNIRH